MNAHGIGKINYILPLYMHADQNLRTKLHKVLMTAARAAIGNCCYNKSITYILSKCNWLTIEKMIANASIIFIDGIVKNKMPRSIYSLFKNAENRRSVVAINMTYRPKSKTCKNFFLYKALKIYNELPSQLKSLDTFKFKKKCKVHLNNINISDTMD